MDDARHRIVYRYISHNYSSGLDFMTIFLKKIRYYWWFFSAFIKNNFSFILTSFVVGFIVIFFFLSIYPSLNATFFRKKIKIGIVGRYTVNSIPKNIISQIGSPLVTITPQGEIVPVLCTSWEILSDKKTFRFHLKQGLKWVDGTNFKASDIQIDFKKGVKIRIIDDTTIEFTLDQPLEVFPVYLTQPIIRKNIYGIGGQYKIQGFTKKKNNLKSINLYPNDSRLPYKVYRFYSAQDELVMAYKKGEINEFETTNTEVIEYFSSWQNTKITRNVDFNRIMTLFFNMNSELFKEREARKAVANAIRSFDKYGVAAVGPIPPTSWAHTDNVKHYSFNLEKAKSISDKLLSATETAHIKLFTFVDYAPIAETMVKDLKKIRFNTTLKILSYIPDEFDIFLTIWDVPHDPDQYIYWHSKQTESNITKYNNIKIDKLLEQGREVVNVQQRKKIYRDFQRMIVDDMPAYFMYYPYVYTIQRK